MLSSGEERSRARLGLLLLELTVESDRRCSSVSSLVCRRVEKG